MWLGLRGYLREIKSSLAETADNLWRMSATIHVRQSRPNSLTDNGVDHVQTVETNIWRLLTSDERRKENISKLFNNSPFAIFVLSAAACCHDFDKAGGDLPPEFKHGEGSADFLSKNYDKLGLNKFQTEAIKEAIKIHDEKDSAIFADKLNKLKTEAAGPAGKYNLRLIAALLKAADILHADCSRVFPYEVVPRGPMDHIEQIKYKARSVITGWLPQGKNIDFEATTSEADEEDALCESFEFMETNEWSCVQNVLEMCGLPHNLTLNGSKISLIKLIQLPYIEVYPDFKVPPTDTPIENVTLGCGPLIDCCFPLIVREIKPDYWDCISRSHGLNVDIIIHNFGDLVREVEQKNIKVAVASAPSVVRYWSPSDSKKGPRAVYPFVHMFNAYYVFCKRSVLLNYLDKYAQQVIENVKAASKGTSVHQIFATQLPDINWKEIICGILSEALIFSEVGADLDSAIELYRKEKLGDSGESKLRYAEPNGPNLLSEMFEKFLNYEELSAFVGGITQTAYLQERSNQNQEYIILAGPSEFEFINTLGFVVSSDVDKHDIKWLEILQRLMAWWFDMADRFRIMIFGGDGNDVDDELLFSKIRDGVLFEGNKTSLAPKDISNDDLKAAIEFMKVRWEPNVNNRGKNAGSFMVPSFNFARKIHGVTEALSGLQKMEGLIEIKHNLTTK